LQKLIFTFDKKCSAMSLRIKEVIKEKGLTVQEVADKMGINRVGLSNHINGNPSVEILQRIADALEVNITELFDQPKSDVITCPNCGTRLKVTKE
jgi:transcriptional regulator with XRE-family HTH domain